MADELVGGIRAVVDMQRDKDALAAQIELRNCTELGEISDLCRMICHDKNLHTRRGKCNNGTMMSLWCTERDCLFVIRCKRPKKDNKGVGPYLLDLAVTNLSHVTSEGFECCGKRTLTAQELTENVLYLTQRGNETVNPRQKKRRTGSVALTQDLIAASSQGIEVTKSVVKAADAKLSLKGTDFISSYGLLKPYLDVLKSLNPGLEYEIHKGQKDKFTRTLVLMPYAVHAMDACFDVVGIDTAHLSTIKLPKITAQQIQQLCEYAVPEGGGYLLEKMVVTVVSGRTYNNQMIILAYSIHYTESGLDAHKFFDFLVRKGLPLNRDELTIFTDRHNTYTQPVAHYFPKSLHFLCPLHLKRNIIDNVKGVGPSTAGVDSEVIQYYWKIQGALTKTEFDKLCDATTIAALGPKYVLMMNYLDNVSGNWQLYKASSRNNVLHSMRSSNIVEQVHAWILDARGYGSPYYFTVCIFHKTQKYMNEMKQHIQDSLAVHAHLTPHAHNLITGVQIKAGKEAPKVSLTCDVVGRPLKGSVTYGSIPNNVHVYEVNFETKSCICMMWSQTGVPCEHACMVRNRAIHTPNAFNMSDFHTWCHIAPLINMLDSVEMFLPNSSVVEDVRATADSVYKLFPCVIHDPTASTSSVRIASRGDSRSGGGQSVSSLKRNTKQACVGCGRMLSPRTTSHNNIVCHAYAKRHKFRPDLHSFTSDINVDVYYAYKSMTAST